MNGMQTPSQCEKKDLIVQESMCGQPVSDEADHRLQRPAVHQALRIDPAFVEGVAVARSEVTFGQAGFFGWRSGVR